ncbi:MAG: Uma2 family endonuclease [Gammaproteobacteria bacterium]|nr:Uma2 family endonuclease [Gammaproteobacteria bacterium]
MAVPEAPEEHRSPARSERNPFVGTRQFPLENGDRLTRREFERRYAARPDIKKAELIEGVVHMPSPVRFASHGEPHSWILTWLGTYCASTPGVRVADNTTVRLDSNNEPQPDALLRIEPEAGGRSRLSGDDYVEGAPELIVEVASSSAAYDLHDKLRAYLRNGVREYVVWRVYDEALDWFVLKDGDYMPLALDTTGGVIRSEVFPGLRLAVDALLVGDVARVLAVLQEGIGTAEHVEFVERLQLNS